MGQKLCITFSKLQKGKEGKQKSVRDLVQADGPFGLILETNPLKSHK